MYSKLLVALDGSPWSLIGGEIALSLACSLGAELVVAHVYDSAIHTRRFLELEPVLPSRFQNEKKLQDLRDGHDALMFEGFESLSRGYIEEFLARARERGIQAEEVHREGRNYLILLELAKELQAQLIVLGAYGLGHIPQCEVGSTVLRVLRQAECDVLIARRALAGRRVLVGIDGSAEALSALRQAEIWARALARDLILTAVYDPFFHDQVFKTMAASFSPERQEHVGLAKQEELHEQIIDDGLGQLYQIFLNQGLQTVRKSGLKITTRLRQGKAYRILADEAEDPGVDLVVVGRYGQNRHAAVDLGSHSESLVRQCAANILVTRGLENPVSSLHARKVGMEWDTAALERLATLPAFVRPMAKMGVERFVQSQGSRRVDLKDFLKTAKKMGMSFPQDK